MIGETVHHPQFGPGQIVALYRNGSDWLVRFDSGLRFRRPRHEFSGQNEPVMKEPAPIFIVPDSTPMPQNQFEARQLIEALRTGIAPAQHVRDLTIGLKTERETLVAGLNKAHQTGGAAFAIVGEYGFGKSHIVELTAQDALSRNFLVATTSLDLQELPPHRSFDIYSSLMQTLRYPDTDERGLAPLLNQHGLKPEVREKLATLSPAELDPLVVALEALNNTSSSRQRKRWQEWLMGGRRVATMNKSLPRGMKFPSIYTVGNNARQIAYLLSGVSTLARLANYSGLCVLIDEAESYSLLRPYQRPKAGQFFSAVVYAALREQQNRINADSLPQHRWRAYPPAYGQGQSLFFLFTVTHSDNRMPLEEWLDAQQILLLEPHHTPQQIGQFLEKALHYHALAYGYEPADRQRQVRRGAAEELALGMRNGRLSIRSTVRLAVELYDLLHLHPDYDVATLLAELREQMR